DLWPSEEDIFLALKGVLPKDIVCSKVEHVEDKFHARYDAVRRSYSYSIATRRLAVGRQYAWHANWHLDFGAMHRAAVCILGSHDFTAYSKENAEVKNRVCNVVHSAWVATDIG